MDEVPVDHNRRRPLPTIVILGVGKLGDRHARGATTRFTMLLHLPRMSD